MKKIALSISLVAFLAVAGVSSAYAAVYGGYGGYGSQNCQPIYGGGETCITVGSLLLNKTVQNPTTKVYVDNLSLTNDPKFGAGQKVEYRLSITNTGDAKLDSVSVTDTFPNYISFSKGPGTYDSSSKTLKFDIFNLNANETRTYDIEGVVATNIPTNPAVNCVINQAKAVSGNSSSSDISQVCVENMVTTKGGLPVYPAPAMKQTPATGPEMLPLLGLIPGALGGLFLRRKAA